MDFLANIIGLLIFGNVITISAEEMKIGHENYLIDELAWKFAACESDQIPDIKILDSNNKYSYGMLQIQQGTWEWACKKFGLTCTDIYSYEEQREIFRAFYKVDEVQKHWVNCWKKLKLNK